MAIDCTLSITDLCTHSLIYVRIWWSPNSYELNKKRGFRNFWPYEKNKLNHPPYIVTLRKIMQKKKSWMSSLSHFLSESTQIWIPSTWVPTINTACTLPRVVDDFIGHECILMNSGWQCKFLLRPHKQVGVTREAVREFRDDSLFCRSLSIIKWKEYL